MILLLWPAYISLLLLRTFASATQEDLSVESYSLTRYGRVYDLETRSPKCDSSLPNEKILVANGSANAPAWLPNVQPPSIISESSNTYCSSLVQNWTLALVNVIGVPGSINGSLDTILLDRTQFCGISYTNYTDKCLFTKELTDEDMNDGLLWLNDTCTGSCAFSGMASDWKTRLTVTEIRNGTTGVAKQDWFWASCLNKTELNPLYGLVNKCTSHWARCSASTFGCFTSLGIDMDCMCPGFDVNIISDLGPKERYLMLQWLNQTCSQRAQTIPIYDWFPFNTDGQRIFPPIIQVQPGNRSTDYCSNETYVFPVEKLHCPSKSAKMWLLGSNNLFMIPLALIFGRRTLLKKLSCGYLGRRGSRMWMVATPIMTAVQISGTAINAVLVRDTPGFSDVQVGSLILLWLSRPRISWVVILALPFEADKGMYFSVAASTLATEAILLIAGAYYIGMTADFGSNFGIYDNHKSSNRDFQLLYAGAMMWMLFVFVSIATIIFSVLGVNKRIASISWLGQQRVATKHRTQCAQRQRRAVSMLASVAGDYGESSHFTTIQEIVSGWEGMQRQWNELAEYVGTEATTIRRLSRESKSLQKKLGRSKRSAHDTSALSPATLANTTSQSHEEYDRAWLAKPTIQVTTLGTQSEQLEIIKNQANQLLEQAETDLKDAQTRLRETQSTLARHDHKIEMLVDILNSTNQLSHHQPMLNSCSFSQLASELERRKPWIRSAILDEAHRTTFIRPQTSQEAIDDLRTALQELGTEAGGDGLAARWLNEESSAREMEHSVTLRDYEHGEWAARQQEVDSLRGEWTSLELKASDPDSVQAERLRKIARISACGLLGCWIAQWIWWAGFIGAAGDWYCPPKWRRISAIWTVFSTLNVLIGASI